MSPRVRASLSDFWERQQERAAVRKQKWQRWQATSKNLYAITRRPADPLPLAQIRSFPVHVRIRSISK